MDTGKCYDTMLKNINQLESARGCFICSICCSQWNVLCLDSQTSNCDKFSDHLAKYHKSEDNLICFYCGLSISSTRFIDHVSNHLFYKISTSECLVYSCPLGRDCMDKYSSNVLRDVVIHWKFRHSIDDSDNQNCLKLSCLHCGTRFNNANSWLNHIKENCYLLVHCPVIGCFVKSPSRKLLWNHIIRKHIDLYKDTYEHFSLIEETTEVCFEFCLTCYVLIMNFIYSIWLLNCFVLFFKLSLI